MLWFKILIFFAVLFVLTWLFKQVYKEPEPFETLTAQTQYMLKRNQDVYDDFYSVVYREIMMPQTRIQKEVELIEATTQPSKQASWFLDVGSGTGEVIDAWLDKGYEQVYGIELSPCMVSASAHPNVVVNDDFMKRSSFEPNTFTHIMCLNKTLYEIPNKLGFFKNCYSWLKPGGHLVLHAFEMPRSNTSRPLLTPGEAQGWKYQSSLEPGTDEKSFVLTEQMTHPKTMQLRLHEREVYYKELGDIITDAIYCGFIVSGKSQTTTPGAWSPREYIYFLQK